MGKSTEIEWTDATWNPIRGCSRVSEGCRNCYAERQAHRFSGAGQPYEGLTQLVNGHPVWTGKVELVEKHLLDPLKWGLAVQACADCGTRTFCDSEKHCPSARPRPRRIFVNSMSDLFHPNVPDEWIDRIFAVMAMCPQHTFQVLTKRPERMHAYCTDDSSIRRVIGAAELIAFTLGATVEGRVWNNPDGFSGICIPNVHLGVSVEDQATADERIPLLLRTPAAVRFVSAEPLLVAIFLRDEWMREDIYDDDAIVHRWLDWVICGGESGPGARPMHPDWVRGLRDQCVAAGVPFFFKQWGEWGPKKFQHLHSTEKAGQLIAMTTICASPQSEVGKVSHWAYPKEVADGNWGPVERMERIGRKAAGALLDGREWKEFPRG